MGFIKKHFGFIIVFLLSLIPLVSLIHSGFPLTHDGQDHIARIANFYGSLTEGNIIPRWAGNLNWGYGHPILMFLYPLPSYSASLFHFLGFSFVDAIKLVFAVSYTLSGIAMYVWGRNVFGKTGGIVVAVLYLYAPYRFVDFYVRGAIGEHVAFVFLPLILYFMYRLSKKYSSFTFVGGCFSIACLLLSHNAIAIMFLPFAGLYAGILLFQSKDKLHLFLSYTGIVCFGVGLSSFFLIPAFFEGKYTLRNIVTGSGEYKTGFVTFLDFFIPSWSYGGSLFLSKQIGSVQIVGLLVAVILVIRGNFKKEKGLFILSLVFFAGSIFLMLPVSNIIWEQVSLIQKFQFPWRLLAITTITSAILCSYSFLYIKKKRSGNIYACIICTAAVLLYIPYYQPQGYLVKTETFYKTVYKGTTDTGESSPIWSVRFMERKPVSNSEFIDGDGTIQKISRTSTKHVYEIDITSKTARIRENTLYFPNWQVYVDGIPTSIEFQDRTNRGLITYYLSKGKHTVSVEFHNTKLRSIADMITVVSIICVLIIAAVSFIIRKKK